MGKPRGVFREIVKLYLTLLVIFLSSSCIYAQEWQAQESGHFILYYRDADQEFLDNILDRAEFCYRQVAEEFGFFREESWLGENRGRIYVFGSKKDYVQETGMPEWSQGSARPLEKTVYTYAGAHKFLNYIIAHEIAHLVFSEFLGNKRGPLWLEEGVAVYIERKDSAFELSRKVSRLIRDEEYIPFREMLTLDFESLDKERDPSKDIGISNFIEKFYLESWSMVYFLITQYDIFEFRQLASNLKQGRGLEESFLRTYRNFLSMEEFQAEWKEFYR